MLAMGLSRLALVAPSRFPDHEATRRATGATAVLDAARIVDSLDDALEGVSCSVGYTSRPREFAGVVVSARDAAALAIASARAGRESALVFGTEMSGLSNDDLARCTAVATIPTNPAFASLNLAAAVQVAAYASRRRATPPGRRRASRPPRTTRSNGCTSTRSARSSRCGSCTRRCRAA
jgi:tRNA/rRNA methyltransferase